MTVSPARVDGYVATAQPTDLEPHAFRHPEHRISSVPQYGPRSRSESNSPNSSVQSSYQYTCAHRASTAAPIPRRRVSSGTATALIFAYVSIRQQDGLPAARQPGEPGDDRPRGHTELRTDGESAENRRRIGGQPKCWIRPTARMGVATIRSF